MGILMPPAGIALAIVSRAMADNIETQTQEDADLLYEVKRIAWWGVFASLWWVWVLIVLLIIAFLTGYIQGLRDSL